MSHSQSVRSQLVPMLATIAAALAMALFAASGSARAEEPKGYGELTRFAETGDEKGHLDEMRTRAIGVDPTDNSVYVADEPQAPNEKKGTLVREIRIQKFKASPEGKYALSASVSFTESSPAFSKGHEVPPIEGIAVDPKAKRVYLLVADTRKKTLAQDKETSAGGELFVASTLYAFSTQESGENLVGVGTEGPNKEILTGPEALHSQSETAGAAILQPRGITADPETGEAIIFGHVDPNTTAFDSLSSDHYAVQHVHADGTLGSTYVDSTDVLKKELESSFTPSSPVVVEVEGKDRVELLYGGLVEIPTEGPPKRLLLAPETGIEQGITGSPTGGRLSASPDGTVWGATGSIKNESATEPFYAGLAAFSGANGAEIGWTGGQAAIEPARTLDKCVIEPYGKGEVPHLVAAGSGGKVFALAPEFLLREEEVEIGEEEFEIVKLPGPFFPAVIEFGPGGGGCPGASAGAPVAKVGGAEIKGEEPVSPGSTVVFSSHVKQADALKVEWDFGDGSPKQTFSSDQFQSTHGEHKFEKEGTFTITETIYSDDLAAPAETVYGAGHFTNPRITVTRTLTVSPKRPKPEFSIEPSTVNVGQEAAFSGEAPDANGAEAQPLEYSWNFGDGAKSAASTSRTAKHAYAAAGTYTVTLTVVDHLGFSGSITHTVTVNAPPSEKPVEKPAEKPVEKPIEGGHTGVLSYQVGLAGSNLAVTRKGTVAITVRCMGQSSCAGTITLRTLTAVSAKARKQILALGSGSFATIAGGQSKSVSVHLSSKALKLLAHSHTLRVRVTIVAHGSDGSLHTNLITITLRAYKGKHH
jgi:PKD repeat protein